MKSVLISIQPQWCELIASGKKTVEVRKTKPKIETPFKCYIYCTKDFKPNTKYGFKLWAGRGKVIGEFVCDKIFDVCIEVSNPSDLPGHPFPCTGLTDIEIMQYLGNGRSGYGWHISNLVVYDKPRDIDEYYRICDEWEKDGFTPKCKRCDNYWRNDIDMLCECAIEGEIYITKPPQSWCYVEEVSG